MPLAFADKDQTVTYKATKDGKKGRTFTIPAVDVTKGTRPALRRSRGGRHGRVGGEAEEWMRPEACTGPDRNGVAMVVRRPEGSAWRKFPFPACACDYGLSAASCPG